MKINLQITRNGESKTVTANAADMVAFESKYNVSVASLSSDPKMSYLLFLAWHAEHRQGNTKDKFEDWLNDVETVGAGEESPK